MSQTFTVLGATGHVGSAAAYGLLKASHHVRVLLRNVDSDAALALKKAGATLIASGFKADDEKLGSLSIDEKILTTAFTGVDGVFILIPPNLHSASPDEQADEYLQLVKRAVLNSGVKKAVFLSSVGAHQAKGTGAIEKLHRLEVVFEPLAGPNLRIVFVRAGYFFTNLHHGIPALPKGIFPFPYEIDQPQHMLSTDDIGDEVAKHLVDTQHTGGLHVVELAGPEDISFAQATKLASDLLGKDIQYVKLPIDSLVETYKKFGLSQLGAESIVAMVVGIGNGTVAYEHYDNLTRGTRTLKDFLAANVKH